MIDTIVLILKNNEFEITAPELFNPNALLIFNKKYKGLISKQNPTTKELKHKIYKPHLTLRQSYEIALNEPTLKIELSLPKLLFGNNFQELRYKDFKSIATKLISTLEDMGVKTSIYAIENAHVSSIHYSKNILFTDGTIPYHYINKIRQANTKLSLDVNQTDYRNEGHSFKWHCNSYEVIFYDKLKDLEKAKRSDKRAIEKDNGIQLNIFKKHKSGKLSKLEVLRMEVRLNKREKIKQLFRKLNIELDLTFKKLFKPAISKKVLLHYLDEIENKRPTLLDYKSSNDKDFLSALIAYNPLMSSKHIIQIFGLKKALEHVTQRELQGMLAEHGMRSWQRLIKEANLVRLPRLLTTFSVIRENIKEYKPTKI